MAIAMAMIIGVGIATTGTTAEVAGTPPAAMITMMTVAARADATSPHVA